MSKKYEIVPGQKLGYLEMISETTSRRDPSGQLKRMVIVKCICGTIKTFNLSQWMKGDTHSCGCKRVELMMYNPFNPTQIKKIEIRENILQFQLRENKFTILNEVQRLEHILYHGKKLTSTERKILFEQMFFETTKFLNK